MMLSGITSSEIVEVLASTTVDSANWLCGFGGIAADAQCSAARPMYIEHGYYAVSCPTENV